MQHLGTAYHALDSELRYTFRATMIRDKLEAEHEWPVWLQISN